MTTAPGAASRAVTFASVSPAQTLIPGGNRAMPAIAADPRRIAPPNLLADVPAKCQEGSTRPAFNFAVKVDGLSAEVDVVRCDAARSFGPLVYVVISSGWDLRAKGGFQHGFAYQAFGGGPVSGNSSDEFGLAWTSGDGVSSHLVLYRVGHGLETFWDSSAIGLSWSLASFSYQASADESAGYLIVTSADSAQARARDATTTGSTASSTGGRRWSLFPAWVRSSRQPYGIGP
jgi:hypothetical protein